MTDFIAIADQKVQRNSGLISLPEAAYSAILAMIREGTLGSQRIIREAELARILSMSRTPVREALLRLRTEGILGVAPRGGFVLVEVDEGLLIEAFAVRSELEGLAFSLAAEHATKTQIAQLEETFELMENSIARDDDQSLLSLNTSFHNTVALASRNSFLLSSLANIRGIFGRYRPKALRQPLRKQVSHKEHAELLAAIVRRDVDQASLLAEQHVRNALAALLQRDGEPQPT